VVRTASQTTYEEKLKKKTRTSGCAVGTVFGDMMEGLEGVKLPRVEVRTSWLYALAAKINRTPSLYLSTGAIHGTVLCRQDQPLVYMEDVGRHNAVDKIAGWMLRHEVEASDKILYTTGRLTSEMVIKTAMMGIPVLASRSGFTAWGVEIAQSVGLTLIGRMRGQRFQCLAGEDRLDEMSLGVDEFVLATPHDHPLAKLKSIGQQDLVGTNMLLLEEGHCLRDQALSFCTMIGKDGISEFGATSLATLVELVVGGHGVTLLPQMAVPTEISNRADITAIAFSDLKPEQIGRAHV